MFESLTNNINQALKGLTGKNRITEINVATTMKEIRKALVEADVNYKVAKDVTDRIKEEALGKKIFINVNPGEMLTKIMADELAKLMGGSSEGLRLTGSPSIILMAGLQGSGKTTFSGKLAAHLKRLNKKPLLVACDVYRPAAIEQLKVLAEQVGVDVYTEIDNKNPLEIAKNALAKAKENHNQVVIVDTAGRLAVDEQMMNEISDLKNNLKPNEILFVVDSMTGQDAVNTAKAFNDKLDFTGIILTKLDGDARGGAALSIRNVVDKPIKFIGTGETMDDIDVFYPDRMANRILNMGDVLSLVERAQRAFDSEESKKIAANIRKNQFDFNDFLSQIEQMKKMGNIKDVIGMIPGLGKMMKGQEVDENAFVPLKAIIQSMTPKERQEPDIIDGKRRKRIADGSGTSVTQVNNLLKQFNEMKKVIKKMNDSSKSGRRWF
ncbi:MAG: signal recognition particle protein [Bacteroidetes bacterium]|nr:MAG: signal recognition particle protein [Bacteroidota bacterium]TAG89737.1 MAG: signal recognition particle protein [Bacteroidota bacterium]